MKKETDFQEESHLLTGARAQGRRKRLNVSTKRAVTVSLSTTGQRESSSANALRDSLASSPANPAKEMRGNTTNIQTRTSLDHLLRKSSQEKEGYEWIAFQIGQKSIPSQIRSTLRKEISSQYTRDDRIPHRVIRSALHTAVVQKTHQSVVCNAEIDHVVFPLVLAAVGAHYDEIGHSCTKFHSGSLKLSHTPVLSL